MNNQIDDIFIEFAENNINIQPEKIIAFYRKNSVALNNVSKFDVYDIYEKYMIIKANYSQALFTTGNYKNAIESCEKQLELIQNHKDIFALDLLAIETLHMQAQQIKACSLYRLKKYKESLPIFEYLVKNEPDNEGYKEWYDANLKKKNRHFLNILTITPFILLLITYVFDFPYEVSITIKIVALAMFVSWGIIDIMAYLKNKKLKVK